MASIIEDEKDKKIAAGEEFAEYDTLAVRNKQPGFVYRWVKNQGKYIARQESRGWEIVRDGPERSVLQPWSGQQRKASDVDGTIVNNDMILARMPEDVYHRRLRIPNQVRIAQNVGAIRQGVQQAAGALMTESEESLTGGRMNLKQYEELAERLAGKKG